MAFITSVSILQTKNAGNVIVVPVNRALRFVGATVAPDGPAQTVITIAAGTNTWNESGNVLTGGTPTTPNEFFGSNNDYDVIEQRNSIEKFRLVADGVQVSGRAHVDGKDVLELLVDPTAGAGVPAPIGSLGMRDNGGVGETWQKHAALDTDWFLLDSSATDEWLLAGNTLTGAGPTTPNEFFGSNNDYDVVSNRNVIEYQRFNAAGVAYNLAAYQYIFASNSLAFGTLAAGATFDATGVGSLAKGSATGAGSTIQASGAGSFCSGQVFAAALLQATGPGSIVIGYADGTIGGAANVISAGNTGSHAFGQVEQGGAITSGSIGGHAHGYGFGALSLLSVSGIGGEAAGNTNGGGQITSFNSGAKAFGDAGDSATIIANGHGAIACGVCNNVGSSINAAADGAFARGSVLTGGTITASGIASSAFGLASSGGSVITSSGTGSLANGSSTSGSTLSSTGTGSIAAGFANGGIVGCFITASAPGALAMGQTTFDVDAGIRGRIIASGGGSRAQGAAAAGDILAAGGGGQAHGITFFANSVAGVSTISASAGGAQAYGAAADSSNILSSHLGTFASGHAITSATISATAEGAFAQGYALSSAISASGRGAFASGKADGGLNITASGGGSFAHGDAGSGAITASGSGSTAFGGIVNVSGSYAFATGFGLINSSYGCLVIGRYGTTTGATPGAWIATDPVFLIGNGTGVGAEASAYQIDKDGKQTTTAAIKNKGQRSIAVDTTLSLRTDYKALVDTSGGVINITLPVGEDGLEYFIKNKSQATNNVNILTSGGDTLEAGVTITPVTDGQCVQLTYEAATTTWFLLSNA